MILVPRFGIEVCTYVCKTYVHIYIHTYVCICVRTYGQTYIPTYMHTYIHTYIHVHIRVYVYKHDYIYRSFSISKCVRVKIIICKPYIQSSIDFRSLADKGLLKREPDGHKITAPGTENYVVPTIFLHTYIHTYINT